MGTVIGAHSFLKIVTSAKINPPIPHPINNIGLRVSKVKYPVPTRIKRLMAVLLTVPSIVIFSLIETVLLKVFFNLLMNVKNMKIFEKWNNF